MSHPAHALQAGVVAALKAHAPLTALVGARIYDRIPAGPVFPYLTIGEDQILDDGTTCDEAWECFVTVHGWSRTVGKVELKLVMAAAMAALGTVEASGFIVTERQPREVRYLRDPDGLTEHAVATYRYLIDPA